MNALTFVVFGIAQPQGSAKAFMRKGGRFPIVTSDNPQLKGWRQLVAQAASQALTDRGRLIHGPIRMVAAFYLPRPKAIKGKVKPHLTRPDVDKLARGICDALSGVVWGDDSQVVQLKVTKEYAGVGESPRAVIVVTPLQPEGMLPI